MTTLGNTVFDTNSGLDALTVSHTLEASANRVFIIAGSEVSGAYTVSGVTYGGVAATLVGRVVDGTGGLRNPLEVWEVLDANLPAAGANDAVVSWDAASSQRRWVGVVSAIGAVQTAITLVSDGNDATTTLALAQTVAANDLVITAVNSSVDTTYSTTPTGYTVQDTSVSASQATFSLATKEAGSGSSDTNTWTAAASGRMTAVSFAIGASGAPAPTLTTVTFDAPAWPNVLPNTALTATLTDSAGPVTLGAIQFSLPTGWSIVQSDGTTGTSLADEALDTYGITLTSSDYIATDGYTVDVAGNVLTGTDGPVRFWDASAATWHWTTESSYSDVPALSVDSTSAGMQRGASFDVTFSNAATTPTTGNTSLASGNDTLTCTSVTGAGPYTATFTVGDLSKQVDGTGYVWTLTVDAETDNTSAIPLTIQADYTLVDLVDPVSSQGSMLEGYTGTAAVSGDHLEYDITSTLDSGVTVSVLATGEVNVSQAVDGDWVSNITIDRRVVQTDGTIGITDTMTIQVSAGGPDTTKPVITLTGASVVTLSQGAAYTELGATWTDNVDGSGAAVVGGATVNVNTLGQYVVTYNYTDVAGNVGDQVVRTVNIVDTTIPVITLVGASTVSHEATLVYNDLGATATDDTDGDITSSIVVTNTVNTGLKGSYTVRYNVSDAAGNDAVEVVRTVNVVDTTAPSISLNGGSVKQVLLNGTYTELGATAYDNYDGDITGSVVIAGDTVDETTLGTYVVTYNAMDSSDNPAVQKTRSVEIVLELDTIPPADRTSINRIAAALREAGTYDHKQTNDLVMEWLESEGITRGALNQMLYGYLGGLGYSGTIQDRMAAWSRDT